MIEISKKETKFNASWSEKHAWITLVKTKIVYTLPDVPFVQGRSELGMVTFQT